MGNVYSLDADKNLILYSAGTSICLRTSIGSSLTRAVVLCNDYLDNLFDIVYNNTIYYVYRNTSQDIVVKSVTDLRDVYRIKSLDTPDCFMPRITVLAGQLMLFYIIKNPLDESYCLKGLFPLDDTSALSLPDERFSDMPAFHIIMLRNSMIVYLGDGKKELIFRLNENLVCETLVSEPQLKGRYKELLSQSKADIDAQKLELGQTKENLSQAQEELAAVREQASKYAAELDMRDKLIESIKKQYNELMDTATQYRAEAIKWHDKYYS